MPKSYVPLIESGKKLIVDEVAHAPGSVARPDAPSRGFKSHLADSQFAVHVRPLRIRGALKYLVYRSPIAAQTGNHIGAGIRG
ncbi:MAG: hypothetical protein HY851_11555 [candidate division Zixibacteria bacterium]|nr:hypothetical protein [candidate division Zixibacteria bacterium]